METLLCMHACRPRLYTMRLRQADHLTTCPDTNHFISEPTPLLEQSSHHILTNPLGSRLILDPLLFLHRQRTTSSYREHGNRRPREPLPKPTKSVKYFKQRGQSIFLTL